MTTPEDMQTNVQNTLDYLDTVLPNGSHVTMMGLADGMILFDSMHNQIHPVGKWRQDVTYSTLYDYLNCLEISPCGGWMTSNDTLRNITQTRANELSAVIKNVRSFLCTRRSPCKWKPHVTNTFFKIQVVDNATATGSLKNFDVYYFPNPIVDILHEWEASGRVYFFHLRPA